MSPIASNRQPALFALVLLVLLATLVSAFLVIYSTHQTRKAFAQLQQLKQTQRQLEVEQTQYLLEKSSLVSPAVLEKKANEQLRLQRPTPQQIVIMSHE